MYRGRDILASTSSGVVFMYVMMVPVQVSALSFVQAVGFFHIVFGLLLAFTILIFGTGIVMYLTRFNTWPSNRDAAIAVLRWAVAMLFMLVILMALVNFFQNHSEIALPILAFILVIGAAILVLRVVLAPKKPTGGEEEGGGAH